MVNQNAGLDVLRKPMVQALISCGPVGNLIANGFNSMSAIHFILYFQGMEGAVVSDRNGVCVISCAVEGKGAKLDPFMRCDTLF